VQSVLRAALADAVHDELLEHNVMSDWTYERKEAPKPVDDVDPLTAEEQAEVLKAATEPQHRNLIQFAFWSGCARLSYARFSGAMWTGCAGSSVFSAR